MADQLNDAADLNKDGCTTRSEAAAKARQVFQHADKNNNGFLTKSELRKYFKKNPAEKNSILGSDFQWKEFFTDMDTDGDHKFDVDELANFVTRSFSGSSSCSSSLSDSEASAEEPQVPESSPEDVFDIRFRCYKLARLESTDLSGKSDPLFKFQLQKLKTGPFETVYESAVIKQTLEPTWGIFKIKRKLFGDDDTRVRISVFDDDTKLLGLLGKDSYTEIGIVETTFGELKGIVSGDALIAKEDCPKDCLKIVKEGKSKNSGYLQVMMCSVGGGSSSQLEDEIRRLKEEMEQLKISAAEATEAKVEAEQEMGLARQEAEAAKQDAEAANKARAEAETERDAAKQEAESANEARADAERRAAEAQKALQRLSSRIHGYVHGYYSGLYE